MTTVKFKVRVPLVPNFVQIEMPVLSEKQKGFTENPYVSIGTLSDEQLEELVAEWRVALFNRAKSQRERKIN
jgi:hypothetical protein